MPVIRKLRFTSSVNEAVFGSKFDLLEKPSFIFNIELIYNGVPKSFKLLTVNYDPFASANRKYVVSANPNGFTRFYQHCFPSYNTRDSHAYFETFNLQLESRHEYFGVNRKDGGTENSKISHHGVYQKVIKPIMTKIYREVPYEFYSENSSYNVNFEIKKNNRGNSIYENSETTPFIGNSIQNFLTNINTVDKALKDAASEGNNPDADKIEQIFAEVEKQSEQENKKMANSKVVGLLAPQETLGALGEAVKQGAQVAVADEAANAVLAVAEVMVGDAYPELAKTDGGKKVVKLVAATLLHHAANAGVPFIPDAEATKFACNLVMQAAARDLIQPKIAVLTPALAQLAAVGKTALGASQG